MKEPNVNPEEVRTEIDEQLKPVVIAQVSAVTGVEDQPGRGDPDDTVIWGNEP